MNLADWYFILGVLGFSGIWALRLLGFDFSLLKHGKTQSSFDLTVPKRWFAHFYLVGLLISLKEPSLFSMHLGRRFLEEVWLAPHASRMHILHYLMGLSFYPMALLKGPPKYNPLWFLGLQVGQSISHITLWRLRSGGSYQPIPKRGVFRFILCPHYLAEILLYWGGNPWVFAFVALNVSLSAQSTHQWYQSRFGPDPRAALIPGVF